MLKDESPVSEYYQVNRAVKDTFMVDQAMEVILHQVCLAAYVCLTIRTLLLYPCVCTCLYLEARNIQDTWDWLFTVVDRIGSHSRQSSMDDVEQFCQVKT
jgi:hypothetical protein